MPPPFSILYFEVIKSSSTYSLDSHEALLKANDTAFKNGFAVYVGNRVGLAHDVMVHGPAYIGKC